MIPNPYEAAQIDNVTDVRVGSALSLGPNSSCYRPLSSRAHLKSVSKTFIWPVTLTWNRRGRGGSSFCYGRLAGTYPATVSDTVTKPYGRPRSRCGVECTRRQSRHRQCHYSLLTQQYNHFAFSSYKHTQIPVPKFPIRRSEERRGRSGAGEMR